MNLSGETTVTGRFSSYGAPTNNSFSESSRKSQEPNRLFSFRGSQPGEKDQMTFGDRSVHDSQYFQPPVRTSTLGVNGNPNYVPPSVGVFQSQAPRPKMQVYHHPQERPTRSTIQLSGGGSLPTIHEVGEPVMQSQTNQTNTSQINNIDYEDEQVKSGCLCFKH